MQSLVMGVLNVTPDSFSDGGRWFDREAAIARGLELVAEGADVLDVGGESTRPGAGPVDEAEERRRVLAVVEAVARFNVVLGASRKSFLGRLTGAGPALPAPVEDRGEASLAASVWAMTAGAAMVRVHDVAATVQAARIVGQPVPV